MGVMMFSPIINEMETLSWGMLGLILSEERGGRCKCRHTQVHTCIHAAIAAQMRARRTGGTSLPVMHARSSHTAL